MKNLLKKILGQKSLGQYRKFLWMLKPPEREVKWLRRLVELNYPCGPKIFFDIGAHLGMYSVALEKIFTKCIAIEANPTLCKLMANSGLPSNCLIENLAVSDNEGLVQLRIPIINTAAGLLNLGEATIEPSNRFQDAESTEFQSIQVRCMPLDAIVTEKYKDLKVAAIKIDVEGHEASVINGATHVIERFLPILLVEMEYRHGADIKGLFHTLESMGYLAFRVSDSGRNLISTQENDLLILQSPEKLKLKKSDLYSHEYVNNIFFIPKKFEKNIEHFTSEY